MHDIEYHPRLPPSPLPILSAPHPARSGRCIEYAEGARHPGDNVALIESIAEKLQAAGMLEVGAALVALFRAEKRGAGESRWAG